LPPRGDARLARLAVAGDPRAFARIYERYHEELYRFCRALLGDAHEAQDALQNTMVSSLASLPGDGRRIALRPWLFRVARNECISILRRRQRPVDPELIELSPAPDPAEDAARRARLEELLRDLCALGERQREALLLRELIGLGYGEIAAALSVSEQAARQAVYEARTALLEMGEGRGMECELVQRALSERDGRRLRGRRYRAHLRECVRCAEFEAALRRRPQDLAALFPLPPGLGAALGGSFAVGGGSVAAGGAGSAAAGGAGSVAVGGGAAGVALGMGPGAKLAAT
jgi:RNA polymerase sigma factor (sigma-70 family)